MKHALALTLILAASCAYSQANPDTEGYEVCTYDGPCALRVFDAETGASQFLVKEDATSLPLIWQGGDWYLVSDSDYEKVRADIPMNQRWTVPAVNPTTKETLREAEAKGGKTSTPPATGGQGGSLVSINAPISISSGDSGCKDCHKGSTHDIHKKKLETGGK